MILYHGDDHMNSSILETIKKLLGISSDYVVFDQDLIIHINSVLNILTQLGVGPTDGYAITDSTNLWCEFINTTTILELVKTYIYLKVRLIFDPPTSSIHADAIQKNLSELEYRILVTVNPKGGF